MLRTRAATVGVLLIGWVSTGIAAPCGGFTDVDDTNPAHAPFCDSVEWMKNRGITLGLTATLYDPNSAVTRLQMAAFMYRLGFQNAFLQGGNAFGTTAVSGTTDNQAVEVVANGRRTLRIEARDSATFGTGIVNFVAGSSLNSVACSPPSACTGTQAPIGGTVSGGHGNRVTDDFGTVGGGRSNDAGNADSSNTNSRYATVGGGLSNWAYGTESVIGGGSTNFAMGLAAVIGGGNLSSAHGDYGTVPGGYGNVANGNFSFAAGLQARSMADGCFTWADSTGAQYECTGANAFTARASGGVYFRTNAAATIGVNLFPGDSSWAVASDRALKENIVKVDVSDILERLARVPISTWNYLSQDPAIRHIGPMAQDLHAAFGLGGSDKHINTIDADGVALAAIQGLNAKLEAERAAKDAEIAALQAELAEIRSVLATIAPDRPTQKAEIAP